MTTTAVIKHFNVFEQVRHGFAMRAIPRAVNPLVLQAVEEAFRRRIVPTISFAAHRAAHPVRGQLALEVVAGVLAASDALIDVKLVVIFLNAKRRASGQ